MIPQGHSQYASATVEQGRRDETRHYKQTLLVPAGAKILLKPVAEAALAALASSVAVASLASSVSVASIPFSKVRGK